MRTQSRDTHPDAERMLVAVIRAASSQKRFRLVQSLTNSMIWSNIQSWRSKYPAASEREAAVHYVSCAYGARMAECFQKELDQHQSWQVQPVDLIEVILPVWRMCSVASDRGGK